MNRLKPLLALLLCISVVACEAPPEEVQLPRPVRAMKVPDPEEFQSRSLPGLAKATQEVNVSFRVGGPLVSRPVNVGDEVQPGDIMATIDPRDFETQIQNVEGRLDRGRAALVQSERDLQRQLNLQREDPGAISQRAVDRAIEARDSDRANVKSLEAELDDAKNALEDTYLRAPYKGRVTAIYVDNHEVVAAKQAIVRVLDTTKIEMIINVPQTIMPYAPFITKIDVRFDGFPDNILQAEVKEVGTEASTVTRTYPITLIMDPPDDVFVLPGMAGSAQVYAKLPAEVVGAGIPVPSSSVAYDTDGNAYVWLINEATKQVFKQIVTVRTLANDGVRVVGGIKPGDWIVTAGVHYLDEGQMVRIQDQEKQE